MKRRNAKKKLEETRSFLQALNQRLASPHSQMTGVRVAAEIDNFLRSRSLLGVYAVHIHERQAAGKIRLEVELAMDECQWKHRRRYDGFSVLVGHPELPQSAPELCKLYRAKDLVEKDFETIKGFIKLRPVRHRTNTKVRAHVDLCMLALLLERTLERELQGTHSPQTALEYLADCRLNRYATQDADPAYTITATSKEQADILQQLRMQELADDHALAARIRPR